MAFGSQKLVWIETGDRSKAEQSLESGMSKLSKGAQIKLQVPHMQEDGSTVDVRTISRLKGCKSSLCVPRNAESKCKAQTFGSVDQRTIAGAVSAVDLRCKVRRRVSNNR